MSISRSKIAISKSYLAVSILGKSLKLNIKYSNINHIELIKQETEIILNLPKTYKSKNNTEIVNLSIQKLYSQIAETEIENALETVRHILHFAPEDYKIERLPSEFYKCTKEKKLIINPDIIQYNKDIIITTLLQAFCKIKYKINSVDYKRTLNTAVKKYAELKNHCHNKFLKVS